MPVSPARSAAFDILLQVEQEDSYASELLHAPRYAKLTTADHALATELVMGVLRWRSRVDQQIGLHSSQPLQKLDLEVLIALRLGAYQIAFLERVPSRAAVHESVELVKRARKRSAATFVNAVMRKLAGEPTAAETAPIESTTNAVPKGHSTQTPRSDVSCTADVADPAQLAERFAHPRWLVERWWKRFGGEVTENICRFNQSIPETAIRLRGNSAEPDLLGEGVSLTPGALLASARRVHSGDVTKTRAYAAARAVIQDEASQLVALVVGRGASILDCCAAPGGKTRVLADRNPDASIIATELHPHRVRLLQRLVPDTNVRVIAADIRQFPIGEKFARVLADVPCSGTGTLARNPEIKWRLKPEDLTELQTRQGAILQSAMAHVAPGGRLVYSTCSLEREENSNVVEKAVADNSFRILDCREELERLRAEGELVWPDLDSLVTGPYLRTIPGVHPCDGFFSAILERN